MGVLSWGEDEEFNFGYVPSLNHHKPSCLELHKLISFCRPDDLVDSVDFSALDFSKIKIIN